MRVGIYNRWVDTLGGGEQTLGAFAAAFAERHDVDLITHDEPRWDRFADTLGFDLGGVRSRVVPYDPDHYRPVQEASRDYDLFVNCSYLDHVRAYARVNVLQVFFPPAAPDFLGDVAPPAADDRHLHAIGGLYPLERDHDGVYAWTDGHGRFALTAPPGDARVTLTLAANRPGGTTVTISIDGTPLRTEALPPSGFRRIDVVVPAALRHGRTQLLDLRSDTFDPPGDVRPALGVRVATGLHRWTPQQRYVDSVGTYDLLLANSHFTQRWTALRYGRASELLYPPVQVGQFHPGPKQRRIISVGRFFVEGHSKKQLELIELFRRLCDEGLDGWEYHLVGGTHHDPAAAAYYERCAEAARGYPVTLHPDAPLRDLVGLYAGSALYWNATGYGEDPDTHPDRFEHFGMTTVEAMASGCVPLSYARAGQPEVIENGSSGVLFETLDELAAATLALVANPTRRDTMAQAAIERSRTFTDERFRRTLRRLLADTSLGDTDLADA
jgi:glycosyltransferase involved in cell wall biosynthesis